MADADQKVREGYLLGRQKWNKRIDLTNTSKLKRIVARYGWPTISQVGAPAAHAAWLIAQHSNHDAEFQEKALRLMRRLHRRSPREVFPQDVAYLCDRVRVNHGKPQLYGTQLRRTACGTLTPFPIQNRAALDARRKAYKLGSFRRYMKSAYSADRRLRKGPQRQRAVRWLRFSKRPVSVGRLHVNKTRVRIARADGSRWRTQAMETALT
jgi:hypothetical protein